MDYYKFDRVLHKILNRLIWKTVKVVAPKCKDDENNTCFMFMFRSRRSNLSKRLWKARVKRGGGSSNNNETECETQTATNNRNQSPPEYMVFDDLYGNNNSYEDAETVVRTDVLKKLKDHQLEMLLVAVESRGADLSDCVLVPRGGTGDTEAHVRCCQVWRWPDLRHAAELKRLPMCGSAKDPVYICCNPYHWSRLCQPGMLHYFYFYDL